MLILVAVLMMFADATIAHAKELTFTQEDRERIIRLEIKVEEG